MRVATESRFVGMYLQRPSPKLSILCAALVATSALVGCVAEQPVPSPGTGPAAENPAAASGGNVIASVGGAGNGGGISGGGAGAGSAGQGSR